MFGIFNVKESDSYLTAKSSIRNISNKLARIGVDFIDTSNFDLEVKKNKWISVPDVMGAGVQIMGINLNEEYRSVLMHFEPYSHLNPHMHSDEFEVIKIVEGYMRNMVNGEVYERGDVYFIPRSEVHHLVTENQECYMYVLYTKKSKYLKLPHKDEETFEKYLKNGRTK